MATLRIDTPPDNEPVTIDLLKAHLRISISNDDSLLEVYLQAARESVESESGRSLVNKRYRQLHDQFPRLEDSAPGGIFRRARYAHHWSDSRRAIKLLRSPLVAVEKITYIDTSGTLQTMLPAPERWEPKTEYEDGSQVLDANGNLQEVAALTGSGEGAGQSGEEEPVWDPTAGNDTNEGHLLWKNKGPAPTGDFIEDRESEPPRIMPLFGNHWPATLHVPNAVQVYFTSGYGELGEDGPATLKVAIMMAVGVSYENREAVTPELLRELPWYQRLIASERVLDWNPTQ
jgi:hypothetical protein